MDQYTNGRSASSAKGSESIKKSPFSVKRRISAKNDIKTKSLFLFFDWDLNTRRTNSQKMTVSGFESFFEPWLKSLGVEPADRELVIGKPRPRHLKLLNRGLATRVLINAFLEWDFSPFDF